MLTAEDTFLEDVLSLCKETGKEKWERGGSERKRQRERERARARARASVRERNRERESER